jgi:hypothetical protein
MRSIFLKKINNNNKNSKLLAMFKNLLQMSHCIYFEFGFLKVDTKDVMRSSKSTMEKQNNDEKKKDRKTNNSILHKNLKIEEHKPHRTGMYSLF